MEPILSTRATKLDREVRRLLLSPAGRASLKRVGGVDVQIVGKEKEDKPVVAVLCPTYRSPEPQMRDALDAMVGYTRDKHAATLYSGAPVQASVVHWSRNWLLTEQLKSGKPWTHVLFIDDDIVVEPDALVRLLSHKKDIIAGLCTRRNDPPVPNMRFYDSEAGDTRQIWEWPENQLVEVDAVGTGLMLLSMHAVEQVAQVYFDCVWEQDFYRLPDGHLDWLKQIRKEEFEKSKIAYWFRFLPTPKGNIEAGEDIFFCYAAKKYCGIPVFVDAAVTPGHLGNYPFSVRDFLPYRDACIERAKAEGTYKAQPRLEAEIQLVR